MRETLTRTLENAREQLKSNREAKHQLEMDWSDKVCILENCSRYSIAKKIGTKGSNYCTVTSFCLFFSQRNQFSANHLESRSVSLKNSRGNVMYKAGAAIYKET